MADNKLSWLEEVKADAEYAFLKRQREAEFDKQYAESKKTGDPLPGEGVTFEPEVEDKKGKK